MATATAKRGRGRPPKFEHSAAGAEKMRADGMAYIAKMTALEKPPTMAGLCGALGYADPQSLFDCEERPEFSGVIKSLRREVRNWWESRLAQNACTGAIFWLKNYGGMKDQQDVTVGGDAKNPVQLLVTFVKPPER